MRDVILVAGPDGGPGGVCDRATSPLMAMASAASNSIIAAQPELGSLAGFEVESEDEYLFALTQPLDMHFIAGSGFTATMEVFVDGSSGTYYCLFTMVDADGGRVLSACVVIAFGAPVLKFCAATECAELASATVQGHRNSFAFRYTSVLKRLEIWEDGALLATSAVRSRPPWSTCRSSHHVLLAQDCCMHALQLGWQA